MHESAFSHYRRRAAENEAAAERTANVAAAKAYRKLAQQYSEIAGGKLRLVPMR